MPALVSQEVKNVSNVNNASFDPNETMTNKMPNWSMNDEIVISGISGRYPGNQIV
jgi:hypothetical protein